MTPEGKIKAKVTKMLKGFEDKVWYFMPVKTMYGKKSLDYICCVNGWFVAIETKKDAKTSLTALQKKIAEQMEAAGGFTFVVYDDFTLFVAATQLNHLVAIDRG